MKLFARMSPSSLLYNACLLIPILSASSVILTPSLAAIAFTILPISISNLITASLKAAHRLAFSILHETMLHLAYSLQFLRTSYQSISVSVHVCACSDPLSANLLRFPSPRCNAFSVPRHLFSIQFHFKSVLFAYLFYSYTLYCQHFPLLLYFYFDTVSGFSETLGWQFWDFGKFVGVTPNICSRPIPCRGGCPFCVPDHARSVDITRKIIVNHADRTFAQCPKPLENQRSLPTIPKKYI